MSGGGSVEPTDVELWARVRADDARAFGELFERHGARVHGYVLRRTGDVSTAEDVTATVFLEAWRQRGRVEMHQESALPWLFGVAANITKHWHRSRRRHGAALDRLGAERRPEAQGVEHQVEAAADAARVVDRLRDLPEREREVLVLSAWEGLSHAEIAEVLGIAIGTVKSRLSRARARLQSSETVLPPRPRAATPPSICIEEVAP